MNCRKTQQQTEVTNEIVVDLIHAGVEINRSYFRGSVQAYIANRLQVPVSSGTIEAAMGDMALF